MVGAVERRLTILKQFLVSNNHFFVQKKCVELEEKSKNNTMELEKVQMEIADYRKQVSQLEMELESLRGTNDYLERNLAGEKLLQAV